MIDEIFVPAGHDGRRQVEAVAAGLPPDLLQLIGDLLRGAEDLRDHAGQPGQPHRLAQGDIPLSEHGRHGGHQTLTGLRGDVLQRDIQIHPEGTRFSGQGGCQGNAATMASRLASAAARLSPIKGCTAKVTRVSSTRPSVAAASRICVMKVPMRGR